MRVSPTPFFTTRVPVVTIVSGLDKSNPGKSEVVDCHIHTAYIGAGEV